MASNHIPDDLLPQILKFMPVKTLIKFQCVCKSWKSLLLSRFFTDVQLMYSTTKTGGPPTYLRQRRQLLGNFIYILHEQDNTTRTVDFPVLQSKRHFVMSLKVIHGVVCLAYAFRKGKSSLHSRKNVSFWNPMVRKHVTSSTPFESDCNFSGFGFDTSKNDFKAVWSPIDSIYCEVFSARDGKWTKTKQSKCVDDSIIFERDSCFMNGTIHWVTYTKLGLRPHGLVLFECEREEFTSIELPKLVGDIYGSPQVIEYRGLLSVIVSFWREVGIDWEFWTMNHESTWTKTHTYCNLWTSTFTRQLACDYKEIDLHMLDSSDYVFKETMLLMDIGQPSQD